MQGGLAVEFLTYYFTLVVLLAGVMAAASCFSAWIGNPFRDTFFRD